MGVLRYIGVQKSFICFEIVKVFVWACSFISDPSGLEGIKEDFDL
jgi:hypothetical protein